MTRTISVVGALCFAQAFLVASAFAQTTPGASLSSRGANFEPNARDGLSVARPDTCGDVSKAKDSLVRDLGKGVSLLVIPSYGDGHTIAANLIFNYHEIKGSLTVLPEKFELQVHPSGKISTPQKVVRRSVQLDGYDIFQEEVYVEFVAPENFESLSFSFPTNTVSSTQGDSSVLVVRPFFFGVTERSVRTRAIGNRPGCMYSPVSFSRLIHGR